MKKIIDKRVKALPVVLGALSLAVAANCAQASEVENKVGASQRLFGTGSKVQKNQTISNNLENDGLSQITSVSDLRDVAPTDWAYEALRSLVERYGCIVGYPDRTYRGNKPLSRWEFAAGLNACLNTLERLIQEGGISKEDIDKLRRLTDEFRAELAALGARVDNLEGRVSFLENHQFSTTTKLQGEVVFSIANAFGSNSGNSTYGNWRNNGKPGAQNSFGGQAVFTDRVRLNFLTSFTGQDQLKVRLQAGNGGNANGINNNFATATGVNAARLAYDDGSDNTVAIDDLWYRFPIGNLTVTIGANALNLDDVFDTYSPYLSSSGTGSLSRAQRYNSIVYRSSSDGTGIALKYKFNDTIALTGTYLAKSSTVGDPTQGNGLLNGGFTTGAQLDFNISKDFKFGLTYVYSYDRNNPNLFTVGSPIGNNPFNGASVTADRAGVAASWNLFQGLNISAWGGYAKVHGQGLINGNPALEVSNRNADVLSWNAAISFVDLGKEGAVLTFSGGLLPTASGVDGITNSTGTAGNYTFNGGGSQDRNASYIGQIQYAFPITRNIQITPGAYVIFNPNNYGANSEIYVGVLRTTFTF